MRKRNPAAALPKLLFEVLDVETDAFLERDRVGCYVELGKKLLDVIMFTNTNVSVRVPLTDPKETLRVTVKMHGTHDYTYGKTVLVFLRKS